MRECGMLLPIASLPSKYGIGCFSKEAYEFVDQLKEGGQSFWPVSYTHLDVYKRQVSSKAIIASGAFV